MPLTEKQKQYKREYYAKNKDRITQLERERRKIKPPKKEDPEKHKNRTLKYNQTPNGIKSICKRKWKYRGVDITDFEEYYPIYRDATQCSQCDIRFNKEVWKEKKCLDHCHDTGKFRAVVCWNCNVNIIK